MFHSLEKFSSYFKHIPDNFKNMTKIKQNFYRDHFLIFACTSKDNIKNKTEQHFTSKCTE